MTNSLKGVLWIIGVNENVHFTRPTIVAVNFGRRAKQFNQLIFKRNHFIVTSD